MSAPPAPTADDLEALAHKYAFMVEAHEAHRAGTSIPPHATFRAIGQRFPGALKELERLPLDVLARRLDDVRAACRGAPIAAWIAIVHDYHRVLARCLALIAAKRDHAPGGELPRAHLAASVGNDAALPDAAALDAAIVARLAQLPRRPKLEQIAVALVAERSGMAAPEVGKYLGFVYSAVRT